MRTFFITFILLNFLLIGCAPSKFSPREIKKLEFTKTPQYKLDLKKIPAPPKMKFIYMDKDFKVVEKDQATYMILVKKEYAKVAALGKVINALISVSKEQEVLINADINIINSLKEFIALERAKADEYRNLWIDSENAYRQEQHLHKIDNAINKTTTAVISIAAIVAILAL